MPNLETFLTREDTLQRLGISVKTLQRLITKGKIKQYIKPRQGLSPMSVYDPVQVEKLQKSLGFVPAPRTPEHAAEGAPASSNGQQMPLLPPASIALPATPQKKSHIPKVPVHLKFYLNLNEAAGLYGLPRSFIRGLIERGDLPALRLGSGFRISRLDLAVLKMPQRFYYLWGPES